MPTYKSRTSKSASKKSGFQFRWWMALVLVGVIAVIGIVVIQFSHAGTNFTAQPPSACAPAYGIPTTTLRYGMNTLDPEGPCVSYLQTLLDSFKAGQMKNSWPTTTGDTWYSTVHNVNVYWFGPKTEDVVKRFQALKGLPQDSVVGPQTWTELIKACYRLAQCQGQYSHQ